ncbi:MAG: thiolase family protein [Planctomycetota bacterium]|jgi:acetyl-CoA acetyltransferase
MPYTKAYIPYGGYWSSPFSKWQMSLGALHPLKCAGAVGKETLAAKSIDPKIFDEFILGWTVASHHCFYGGPWTAAMCGLERVTGPIMSQACATGARCAHTASMAIETDAAEAILNVTADRCSNGPHLVYPNPMGPGGLPDTEDWVWDNFGFDPWAKGKGGMVATAENVATEHGITREESDECALLRYSQYQDALKDDRAFQKKYMVPVTVNPKKGKKLEEDEGVFPTSKEGLAKLKPVMPDGVITFGAQTFPADGNCGIIVATKEKAAEMSQDKKITIQVISYGEYREKKNFMAAAVVPAAQQALERAGISAQDCKAIKTHNPFSVNDVFMAKKMDLKLEGFNNYGSPMIFGHPQGPTGTRCIIELIEELAIRGGGYGLFAGCAAGDSAAALVIKMEC